MLKAKKTELQTLPGLVAENVTLSVEASRSRDSVMLLARERREVVVLTQDVQNLIAHFKKVGVNAQAVCN